VLSSLVEPFRMPGSIPGASITFIWINITDLNDVRLRSENGVLSAGNTNHAIVVVGVKCRGVRVVGCIRTIVVLIMELVNVREA